MARMHPPSVSYDPPAVLDEGEVMQLLSACEGRTFSDRRDMAIIRLLLDTGMRRGELTGLKVSDVDLKDATALVLGKGRSCSCASVLDPMWAADPAIGTDRKGLTTHPCQ